MSAPASQRRGPAATPIVPSRLAHRPCPIVSAPGRIARPGRGPPSTTSAPWRTAPRRVKIQRSQLRYARPEPRTVIVDPVSSHTRGPLRAAARTGSDRGCRAAPAPAAARAIRTAISRASAVALIVSITSMPPGRSRRHASASTTRGSGTCSSSSPAVTTSAQPSASGTAAGVAADRSHPVRGRLLQRGARSGRRRRGGSPCRPGAARAARRRNRGRRAPHPAGRPAAPARARASRDPVQHRERAVRPPPLAGQVVVLARGRCRLHRARDAGRRPRDPRRGMRSRSVAQTCARQRPDFGRRHGR